MRSISIFIIILFALFLFSFDAFSPKKEIQSIQFSAVPLAKNADEKRIMRVSPLLTIHYSNGKTAHFPLHYNTLAKMGTTIGNGTLGLMTDIDNKPLLRADGSQDISHNPDGNSIIHSGENTYLITHMEEVPGELYQTKLAVKDNHLITKETKPIDLASIGGTLINCASTKTRYGSHLGGEEDYALNTIYADSASPFYVDCALDGSGNDINAIPNAFCSYVNGMGRYFHDTHINKKKSYQGKYFSLYNYGHIIEIAPQPDGTNRVAKHYVTGRYTPELAAMMPDMKTVYMSDDGTAKGLWKFVSDRPITQFTYDWEGTLYAAKLTQHSEKNGGTFALSWIKLGHTKDSEVSGWIKSGTMLSDIFSIQKVDKKNRCKSGYTKIYEDATQECLKLKPAKALQAAFLETRKYAAYKGATTEFRKEEGITYDKDKNLIYLAISSVEKSMEDNYKNQEAGNDIRLPKNNCGAVYQLTLDKNYNAVKMQAILNGRPLKVGEPYADEYACDPNHIANPDNISYIGHNTLVVSEDTSKHVNNMSWAYNTNTGTMTRIASLPIGAEVTGVDSSVIEGKAILLINIQHPFQDNPEAADHTLPNSELLIQANERQKSAEIGYIDALPTELFE